jgi:accessory colonization factor AcfC
MEQALLTNETQLIQQAIQILLEKLGSTDTNRFLSLKSSQHLNSVLRHQTWQETLDKEAFFDDVF